MIRKTLGLTLRISPFSNTSQVVSWLSPDRGRLSTLIKGAQRPRGGFLGQYDLFYVCELLFYDRAERGLHILHAVTPLKTRNVFRQDLRRCTFASYACDLAWRLCPYESPAPGLFRLLDETLDSVEQHGPKESLVAWYELRVLSELGLAPQLNRCPGCGTDTSIQVLGAFSLARGGLLCPRCTEENPGPLITVPPDVLAMLRHWQGLESPAQAIRTRSQAAQERIFRLLIGRFLEYHLETQPLSRQVLQSVLAATETLPRA